MSNMNERIGNKYIRQFHHITGLYESIQRHNTANFIVIFVFHILIDLIVIRLSTRTKLGHSIDRLAMKLVILESF